MSNREQQDHQPDFHVAIIGTGFAGLCTAIQLKKAGDTSFILFEKADEVGGTWRENTYPGAACDVPSHLYSYSFEPNPRWTRMFAPQPEILEYLKGIADKYGLRPHIRFNSYVSGLEFDETAGMWRVTTADGYSTTARAVVTGIGPLHKPAYPNIPGMASFEGRAFHSAEWDHDYDLAAKRVAVIGTGASAIQFVPAIQPTVDKLHVFQRSAQWIIPKADRPIIGPEKLVYRAAPVAQRAYRSKIYWQMESRILGMAVNPKIMKAGELAAKTYLRRHIKDPELRKQLTPDYVMGCKRILISNNYYPALAQSNVEVITENVSEIRPHSVVTADGVEREVDAIIYGTGFQVLDYLSDVNVVGRNGITLKEVWRNGGEAYLGVNAAGFPNLFFLVGPNTGLGHSSMVFMIEAQVNYILECMQMLDKEQARCLDVTQAAQDKYNENIQERSQDNTVWTSGCSSWYLDQEGVNRAAWPGSTVEYWASTRKVKKGDYELIK